MVLWRVSPPGVRRSGEHRTVARSAQASLTRRRHGVRIATVWQSLAQARERYGDATDSILANSAAKVFMGPITDNTTRGFVEGLLGQELHHHEDHETWRPKATAQALQQLATTGRRWFRGARRAPDGRGPYAAAPPPTPGRQPPSLPCGTRPHRSFPRAPSRRRRTTPRRPRPCPCSSRRGPWPPTTCNSPPTPVAARASDEADAYHPLVTVAAGAGAEPARVTPT